MGCSRVEMCMDVSSMRHNILEFHGIPYRLIGSIKFFFQDGQHLFLERHWSALS